MAVVVASLFEIVPTFLIRNNIPTISSVKPYSPLELAGRDLYVSEGCYNCHSQMVRPILSETKRFGEYSKAGEFIYDRPFQWGSRRIGPDLAREGGKQSPLWHVLHFQNPAQVTPRSIMPPYPWLLTKTVDFKMINKRVEVMTKLGVPYSPETVANADFMARGQAKLIADEIAKQGGPKELADKEVIALVAYLQRLGTDLKRPPEPAAPTAQPVGEVKQSALSAKETVAHD
jgi:cytochrome c oxidase cbb3-type subunit I/II